MILKTIVWIPVGKSGLIYNWIRTYGKVSKPFLLEKSKLKISTLTRIIDDLMVRGLVTEAGFAESTGGRKSVLYQIYPRFAYALGVEIDPICSRVVLCDLHLNKVFSESLKMTENMEPDVLLHKIADVIQRKMMENRVSLDQILGMGIGISGTLDRENGVVVHAKHFKANGWKQVRLRTFFEDKLLLPVYLDHSVNTALLGEYWMRANPKHEHFMYVHAGKDIHTSFLSQGNIVFDRTGMEHDAGNLIIAPGNPVQKSSVDHVRYLHSCGTLEAAERNLIALLKRGSPSIMRKWLKEKEDPSYQHLIRAIREKDSLVMEICKKAVTYLGLGLAGVIGFLQPEIVILSGPLINLDESLFQVATEIALLHSHGNSPSRVQFGKSILGENAVSIGAAIMVINEVFKRGE